jgi:hypothetical protein
VPSAAKLLKHWNSRADAIGLGLVKDSQRLRGNGAAATQAPRDHRRGWRHPAGMGGAPRAGAARPLLRQRRVLFFSGLAKHKLAMSMAEYTRTCSSPTRCCSSACPSC